MAVNQVLQLLDILSQTHLEDRQDIHVWTPSASGQFSTKTAYERYFTGGVKFEPYRRLWKTWAPLKVKLFLWLAIWNRVWTADRLARRGMQHPEHCILCDQESKDINHLFVSCSFSRQVWFGALRPIGLERLVPSPNERKFIHWWRRAQKRVGDQARKGFNSLVQLVAWQVWKHRNACIFDAKSPNLQLLLEEIR